MTRLPVLVTSAGTRALVGQQMHDPTQKIAREMDLTGVESHQSQQLTVDMLRESDLILAMDRGHRRTVVEMLPRASRYTFTLREFARLADEVVNDDFPARSGQTPLGLLRSAVESVAQLRGTLPLLENPAQEDIVDPYGKHRAIYRQSAGQIVPAVLSSSLLFNDVVGEI